MARNWRGGSVVLLVAYACLLALLLNARPLWLDEIIQLLATTQPTVTELSSSVQTNRGAAPLGYLVQHLVLRTVGFSSFSARLPAALFSVCGCVTLLFVARRLRLNAPLLIVLLFMSVPAQLRYAAEARPYSQALFLSVASTLIFLVVIERPTAGGLSLYLLSLLAGVYSQPLVMLTAIAHLLWAAFYLAPPARRSTTVRLLVAIGAAVALFLPWFLFVHSRWSQPEDPSLAFHITSKLPLQLVRESSGGGYFSSLGLLAAACVGLWSDQTTRAIKAFLVLGVLTPVAGALLADAAFDYFFAGRQILFMIPALTLLAGEGIACLVARRHTALGVGLLATVLVASVAHDVKFFRRRQEDWAGAARALRAAADSGECILVLPGGSVAYYAFFEPGLGARTCQLERGPDRIAVAITPYTEPSMEAPVVANLERQGLVRRQTALVGGTRIIRMTAITP